MLQRKDYAAVNQNLEMGRICFAEFHEMLFAYRWYNIDLYKQNVLGISTLYTRIF